MAITNNEINIDSKVNALVKVTKRLADGVYNISDDLASGAYSNLKQKPVDMAYNFGIGLATGVLVSALPELAIPILAYTGAELYLNHEKILKKTKFLVNNLADVLDPKNVTKTQLAVSNNNITQLGTYLPDLAASLAGGISGSYISKSLSVTVSDFLDELKSGQFNSNNLNLVDIADSKLTALPLENTLVSDSLVDTASNQGTVATADIGDNSQQIVNSGLKVIKKINKIGKIAQKLALKKSSSGISLFTEENSGSLKK